ncbi:hypothetical protein HZS_786 [Henneguya salminicola]|nr:hypothetical protein HZS_786 [Henneguya salminicola]
MISKLYYLRCFNGYVRHFIYDDSAKVVEENYCYFKEMMKSLQNNSTNKMLESLVENNPQHAFRLSDHNIDESINNLSNCFKNIQLKDNDFLQEFENSENFTSLSTEIINKLKILDKIMIDIQSLFPDINDKITHI